MSSMSYFVKRLFDIFFSLVLISFLLPFFFIIALLIIIESHGSPIFIQDRLGKNGTKFRMYKFRTMVVDAERIGTGLFSYENDPRITKIGKYLRLTSLDELPQLFNVLFGSMSLVGPRPPVTYELGNYDDLPPIAKCRFLVKPGITGLAQIAGRNELDWEKKFQFDNLYVEQFSKHGIMLDIYILYKTVLVVVIMKNVVEKKR